MPVEDTPSYDVVVVGAGQAGLALGYYLRGLDLSFMLLDAKSRVGDSWRERYDSLQLFTPAEYDTLPGLPFPAPRGTYPTKDAVAEYLESYARHFSLPIRHRTRVVYMGVGDGGFILRTSRGSVRAGQVVIATGPFQAPSVPPFACALDASVTQLHSSDYRNREQLPPGEVLVVGGGNSGLQIAEELLATHPVALARGTSAPFLPQRLLGKSLFWWLERTGIDRAPAASPLGRWLQRRDPVIGVDLNELVGKGLRTTARVVDATARTVTFADGRTMDPASIVWATGFRSNYSWIDLPVLDDRGQPRHQEGATEVEGIYFLGLSWQRTRGSALLGWVGRDAAFIADRIVGRLGLAAPRSVRGDAPDGRRTLSRHFRAMR